MTKTQYEHQKQFNPRFTKTKKEVVEEACQSLIDALFEPSSTPSCWSRDLRRIKHHGLNKEPINWGSLNCAEVREFRDGTFLVTVDEADPNCPHLQNYLHKFLSAWGWECEIKTEW